MPYQPKSALRRAPRQPRNALPPPPGEGVPAKRKGIRPTAHANRSRPKVWDPERAKGIPWYPQTEAEYEPWRQRLRDQLAARRAEGKMTRVGVPAGWGGRKHLLVALRAECSEKAKMIVSYMKENEIVTVDDDRAEQALVQLVAIVMNKDGESTKDRISAGKAILDFTKKKPAQKVDVAVRAEDWLDNID